MNAHNIETDLSKYDDEFAKAEIPASAGNDTVPDGKYGVYVERLELTVAKTSGNPLLKWQLRIDEGPSSTMNRVLFRNNMLSSAQNMSWLKKDLKTCGVELAKLSDLKEKLPGMLDMRLSVTVKNRKDNSGRDQSNVYLDKVLRKREASEAKSAEPKTDVPF